MDKIEKIYKIFIKVNQRISTDSRNSSIKNSIFFGIKGPNFNGNQYAKYAIENGAKYAVVDEMIDPNNNKIIQVHNTIETLQKLAMKHRKNWLKKGKYVIGITGTNGKTTTKEILNSIMCSKFNICFTKGNFNNHIGVPLTILALKKEHEFGIIELGANQNGDIKQLCNIAQPTHGIITNIGEAHLEGFKSIENIKKTKNELYDYIKLNNGTLFVNQQDKILLKLLRKYPKTIFYNCFFLNKEKKIDDNNFYFNCTPFINLYVRKLTIKTKLIGNYNAYNIAASITIANYFGIDFENINKTLHEIELKNNRSELINTKNNKILLDAYNANPTSLSLAIQSFYEFINNQSSKESLIILGDMLELGKYSLKYHQKIVYLLEKYDFKNCILIGDNFEQTNTNYQKISSIDKYLLLLKKTPIKNKIILLKGSRKMKLEKLLDVL